MLDGFSTKSSFPWTVLFDDGSRTKKKTYVEYDGYNPIIILQFCAFFEISSAIIMTHD